MTSKRTKGAERTLYENGAERTGIDEVGADSYR